MYLHVSEKFFLTHNMYNALNFVFFFKIDHPVLKASIEGCWALPLESAASSQAWGWPRHHWVVALPRGFRPAGTVQEPHACGTPEAWGSSAFWRLSIYRERCWEDAMAVEQMAARSQVSVIFQNVTEWVDM